MKITKTKVLICGAAGFIGRNLVERFSKNPAYEVTAVYHKTDPPKIPSVAFVRADLTQREDVARIVKGTDILIQAAATTSGAKDIVTKPYYHVTDNAVMNSFIFRACHENQVKHVIFFSCTTMYPSSSKPVRESDFNYTIVDKYFGVGWTKVYIEKMCEFYSKIGKAKYTAIRHSNIYGPYDKYDLERSHVFGATVAKVMTATDGKIVVWGDGSDERDLLHVDDLITFVEYAINQQTVPFELMNVGYGRSISVKELVEKLVKASGQKLKIEFDTSKPSINYKLTVDIGYAKSKFRWVPKISLDEGIKSTLEWYQKHVVPRASKAQRTGV